MSQNTLWRYTKTHVVVVGVVVVVGATTVLKAIPRERVTVEDSSFQGALETAVRLYRWWARI